jgi:predicted O-methyltransferase YrrM
MENKSSHQATWTAVDHYISNLLIPEDEAFQFAVKRSVERGLPLYNVAPNQGKLLMILARSIGAKAILEVGTLGGYSTIWLAKSLPENGYLLTLEINPDYAKVANENIAQAGFSHLVDLRVGDANQSLETIRQDKEGLFDFIFIDADKQSNVNYFNHALELSHPGSLIVIDNVIRNGAVIDDDSSDSSVQGVRKLNKRLTAEDRVTATSIQTVGEKGYDGFTIVFVNR